MKIKTFFLWIILVGFNSTLKAQQSSIFVQPVQIGILAVGQENEFPFVRTTSSDARLIRFVLDFNNSIRYKFKLAPRFSLLGGIGHSYKSYSVYIAQDLPELQTNLGIVHDLEMDEVDIRLKKMRFKNSYLFGELTAHYVLTPVDKPVQFSLICGLKSEFLYRASLEPVHRRPTGTTIFNIITFENVATTSIDDKLISEFKDNWLSKSDYSIDFGPQFKAGNFYLNLTFKTYFNSFNKGILKKASGVLLAFNFDIPLKKKE